MLTGVNAGRHGMWDFCERDETGYRLRMVNGSHQRALELSGDYLTAANRRSGIVNVPFTSPAPEARTGSSSPASTRPPASKVWRTPASLMTELRDRFGVFEFDHSLPLDRDGYIDVERMKTAIEQKVDACLWLRERFDPDLLLVVFMAADHMQHYGWLEWEERGLESRVAVIYRHLDEEVGAIREAIGPDEDLMLVSWTTELGG